MKYLNTLQLVRPASGLTNRSLTAKSSLFYSLEY